jgi:hypothetical protein
VSGGQAQQQVKVQSEEDAQNIFFGVEKPKNVASNLGAPIPGYSGVNRRVQADNVFGMTYAEARRRAEDSLCKINTEKSDTLKTTSVFVPEYMRPKEEAW